MKRGYTAPKFLQRREIIRKPTSVSIYVLLPFQDICHAMYKFRALFVFACSVGNSLEMNRRMLWIKLRVLFCLTLCSLKMMRSIKTIRQSGGNIQPGRVWEQFASSHQHERLSVLSPRCHFSWPWGRGGYVSITATRTTTRLPCMEAVSLSAAVKKLNRSLAMQFYCTCNN